MSQNNPPRTSISKILSLEAARGRHQLDGDIISQPSIA
jgi:hypothetical protein